MIRKNSWRAAACALTAVAWLGGFSTSAQALDLLGDYQKALAYDPTFQTALAERQANLASATQARVAFWPEGNFSNQRLQTDTGDRRTFTLTQPLISMERIATFRMAEPREAFAQATFVSKQQDLAVRLLKAANAIILANENLKLNAAKMAALDQQSLAAKAKLSLGQGTITDQRDIEVKAAQAKGQQLGFKTALDVAAKQYAAITGARPKVADFVLAQKDRSLPLKSVTDYVDLALQSNPALLAARQAERVAQLDVDKTTGSLFPTISATHSQSKSATTNVQYSGITVNMPLQAGNYYARESVQASYLKAKEATRDVEEKTRLEVEKLREQIATGLELLTIQQDAIAAAELSLEANQKSYEGGVRSSVDVLNATQTVFQVKSDFVTVATSQAENLLGLAMQTATEPIVALTSIMRFIAAE
jgi:protease secretion system outer membrane protein